MQTIDLKVKKRETIGGRTAKRLRKEGNIPAVIYGHGMDPLSLQVDRGELEHALHTSAGDNVVLNLQFEDKSLDDQTVIIKQVQHDDIHDIIEHVDFLVISLTEKVTVKVHIHAKGEAQGVKDGGTMDIQHHLIEVECLPTSIPERITIDVSKLEIGDSVHVSDVVFPEGVECLEEPETSLIVIHAPRAEEEEEAAEEAEQTGAEPEVIKKGKEEEEREGAGAAE